MHRQVWLEAARRAGARQDAEDAIHDACVAALGGALPLDGESNADMLMRLVTTYASGYRRRAGREAARQARVGDLPPFEQLTNIDQRVDVQRAIDHLKESHHLDPTLVWATIQGASVRELAQTVGRSYQPVWERVQRTWSFLREHLAHWREGRKHWGRAARGCGEPGCTPS